MQRLQTFDLLKTFAIFLVVWGHCIQYTFQSFYADEPIYRIIYSFHMPLFMIISGYFATSALQLPFKDFIKKKFFQLIVPCITWGLLNLILIVFYRLYKGENISNNLLIIAIGSLWFLKSLFCCFLIAYIGNLLTKRFFYWICITLIISQVFPLWGTPIMYPCFILGFLIRKKPNLYKNHILTFIYAAIFAILLIKWDNRFWPQDVFSIYSSVIENKSFTLLQLYKEIYRLTIGIIGSLFFISLTNSFFRNKQYKISYFGKYTLQIYVIQSIILEFFLAKIIHLGQFPFFIKNFILTPIISIIIMSFCIFLYKMMVKYNMQYILFGEKRISKNS